MGHRACPQTAYCLPGKTWLTSVTQTVNNIPEKDIQTESSLQHVWSGFKQLENGIQLTTNPPTQPPNKISSPWQLRIYFKVSSAEDRLYIKCIHLDPISDYKFPANWFVINTSLVQESINRLLKKIVFYVIN